MTGTPIFLLPSGIGSYQRIENYMPEIRKSYVFYFGSVLLGLYGNGRMAANLEEV